MQTDLERDTLHHVNIIEEAHNVFKTATTGAKAKSAVLTMLREARELGEAVINADQSLSALADEALMNSYTIIAFSVVFPADQTKAKGSMALSKEQKEMLPTLETGECMVKLGGREVHPFLVITPEVKVQKELVNDEMIQERMKKFYSERGS